MTITPLIFELERRPNTHNVGNRMSYLDGELNFRYKFWFKCSPEPFWKFQNISNMFILTAGTKDRHKLSQKKVFWWRWRDDDVTARRQNRSSLFMFN